MKKYKIKPLVFIILLLSILLVGTTIALFTARRNVASQFQALTYDVDIDDNNPDTWGDRDVTITNNDKTPVVLRVTYSETWSKQDSIQGYLILNNLVNGTNVVNKTWTNTWTNEFTKGGDGWYYYKKVLDSNDSIKIIENVTINERLLRDNSLYDKYNNYDYELNFGIEAIQATEEAIKDLWGFDVSINENTISWS